jgi:hypothetical protein
LVWLIVGVVGACGTFIASTVLNGNVSDALIAAGGAIGFALVALVVGSSRADLAVLRSNRTTALAAAIGAAAAWAIAPMIVMTQRASDAPPGTEVVFFTLTAWGFITLVIDQMIAKERSWALCAGAFAGLVGGMITLASWEFPSSFSPFVRSPDRHAWMCAAGVIFSVGVLAFTRSARKLGLRPALLAGGFGAGASGLVMLTSTLARPSAMLSGEMPLLVVVAISTALFAIAWLNLASAASVPVAALTLLLAPPALTTLIAVERMTHVRGPDPLRWPAVTSGVALVLLAASLIWIVSGRASRAAGVAPVQGARLWTGAGALTAALAVASLFTPAVRAGVEGAFGETYRAAWTMPGVEAASGWLAAAAAALCIAALVEWRRGRRLAAIVSAVGTVLAPIIYPFVAATPLRTATRWIPADVQQSYGTEYARLTFEALHDPVRLVALAMAFITSLTLLVVMLRSGIREHAEGEA